MMVNNMTNVLSRINKNHLLSRFLLLVLGTFVATFIYNKFLITSNIVIGGVSGLAILVKEVFGISTTLFINLSNVALVILSFIVLGKKKTIDQLIGCVTYLLMLNITAPLVKFVTFEFTSTMLMLIFVSIFWGIANGLIYRAGYSTGGTDFLCQIISEKIKRPITEISLVIQVCVILASAFVFNIPCVMLSIFVIYISNKITNAVLFGISTSKMVYIVSKEDDIIEDYIIHKIKTGATEMKIHSEIFSKNKKMLLCVIHNRQYPKFKETVLKIDPEAFLLSNNCYGVSGGIKYSILPF